MLHINKQINTTNVETRTIIYSVFTSDSACEADCPLYIRFHYKCRVDMRESHKAMPIKTSSSFIMHVDRCMYICMLALVLEGLGLFTTLFAIWVFFPHHKAPRRHICPAQHLTGFSYYKSKYVCII